MDSFPLGTALGCRRVLGFTGGYEEMDGEPAFRKHPVQGAAREGQAEAGTAGPGQRPNAPRSQDHTGLSTFMLSVHPGLQEVLLTDRLPPPRPTPHPPRCTVLGGQDSALGHAGG